MSNFTVYGADGRRIVRNVAEAYAHEFAEKLSGETGETLDVVADDPIDAVGIGDTKAVDEAGAEVEEPVQRGRKKTADAEP